MAVPSLYFLICYQVNSEIWGSSERAKLQKEQNPGSKINASRITTQSYEHPHWSVMCAIKKHPLVNQSRFVIDSL